MVISCEYGFTDDSGKIRCNKVNDFCGHVHFCQMNGRFEQTRQAETCRIRFLEDEPKPKKKVKKK